MTEKQPIRRILRAALMGLALVALTGGCVDPTNPRLPSDQDDDGPKDDDNSPDDQGMIIGHYELTFV